MTWQCFLYHSMKFLMAEWLAHSPVKFMIAGSNLIDPCLNIFSIMFLLESQAQVIESHALFSLIVRGLREGSPN